MATSGELLMQDIGEAYEVYQATRVEWGDGGCVFHGLTAPTPWHIREWLRTAREALTWAIPTLAKVADVNAEIIERLESIAVDDADTVELELDGEIQALAEALTTALRTTFDPSSGFVRQFLAFGRVLEEGDISSKRARALRTRRRELGLTLTEVVERTGGKVRADEILWSEWRGAIDHSEYRREYMAALEWPYLQVELVFGGDLTENDVDEWTRWRAEQDATAYRRAT